MLPSPRAFTLNHLAFEIAEDEYEVHLEYLRQAGLEPVEARFEHCRGQGDVLPRP
ncbi:MAG: hypothetical protein R3B67_13470 [Phycisphaerales bacterium]